MGTAIGVGGFSWEEWAFRWETCLSPPGHCDPLSPLLPMYDLISSPVTPSSFCLPIFLLHLEMDPNVTQRVVDGEGRGPQKGQWAEMPRKISLQRPQLQGPLIHIFL